MLKWFIRAVAFVLVLVTALWVRKAPAYDSYASLLTAIGGLLLTFVVPKIMTHKAQTQNLADSAIGVQAGRDANVSIKK
jgi:uncharacterized membrane protein